ncbi:MAG: fructose-6-phosphate aldolase, partial [Bdellovibrionales bacterium]
MKIFIDTADIHEIKEAFDRGWIDGVTTNPSLVSKVEKTHEDLIKEICEFLKDKPVSAEVLSVTAKEMVEEGVRLFKIHPSVVVKIPLTLEGLKAVKELKSKKIPTNVTLCFSANQAALAAKAGATFVSVFVGRLDDIGYKGTDIAIESHRILSEYGFKTQILAASIRHPEHVLTLMRAGVPIFTVPYKVLKQLIKNPLTDIGLKKFLEDAK